MQRIGDYFLEHLGRLVKLKGSNILEIGCGDGARSELIASKCSFLIGIDPDETSIESANQKCIQNAEFRVRKAENLFDFASGKFDIVIFTLSLHHVPKKNMFAAIDEAVRTIKPTGRIVIWEPGMHGSLFDAEIQFDAFDGDERQAKKDAYQAMKEHPHLELIAELSDKVSFSFEGLSDFMSSMTPKKNIEEVAPFLEKYCYVLTASRRFNVFKSC